MKLYVDENVLIPRPETEELVEWVVEEVRKSKIDSWKGEASLSLLDIGTGSGCIPIAVKKQLAGVEVFALDVSEGALKVAKRNSVEQDVSIHFLLTDFLNDKNFDNLPGFDVIVSNPPYIKQCEEATMQRNVLDHEPHLALFVRDEDALIFYRKIAEFALTHLKESGLVYLEINEALSHNVVKLFEDFGYKSIEVRKDMQDKERMVKVMK